MIIVQLKTGETLHAPRADYATWYDGRVIVQKWNRDSDNEIFLEIPQENIAFVRYEGSASE